MKLLDIKPMPEEEHDALMDKVADIMENGGRIPQDVSNELLWAQGIKVYTTIMRTRNVVRQNWVLIRVLGFCVTLLAAIIVVAHGDDVAALLAMLR